jgi:triosephosphate isomerase
MKKKFIGANWKMNLLQSELEVLLLALSSISIQEDAPEFVIFPSQIYLSDCINRSNLSFGAQDIHSENFGAYTGAVSAEQVKSTGAKFVLVGHSERRSIFQESNTLIKNKVDAAVNASLELVFCCGESLDKRDAGTEKEFVLSQLKEGILHLSVEKISTCVIAYEPIWAIGTGKVANSQQIEEMHTFIRETLVHQYGAEIANSIRIIYGGSCTPSNAREIFSLNNVDGGLIGGASLNFESMTTLLNSF